MCTARRKYSLQGLSACAYLSSESFSTAVPESSVSIDSPPSSSTFSSPAFSSPPPPSSSSSCSPSLSSSLVKSYGS